MTARPAAVDTKPVEAVAETAIHFPAGGAPPLVESAAPAGVPGTSSLIGQIVEGTVTGITHFGAFVSLDGGQSGLIHISEIAFEYVRDVRDHVKLNERIRVKALQINPANGKFDLSLKLTRGAPVAVQPKRRGGKRDRVLADGADPVFEEKLSRFMKSSEERLLDMKRNLESKRGGRLK